MAPILISSIVLFPAVLKLSLSCFFEIVDIPVWAKNGGGESSLTDWKKVEVAVLERVIWYSVCEPLLLLSECDSKSYLDIDAPSVETPLAARFKNELVVSRITFGSTWCITHYRYLLCSFWTLAFYLCFILSLACNASSNLSLNVSVVFSSVSSRYWITYWWCCSRFYNTRSLSKIGSTSLFLSVWLELDPTSEVLLLWLIERVIDILGISRLNCLENIDSLLGNLARVFKLFDFNPESKLFSLMLFIIDFLTTEESGPDSELDDLSL